MNAKEKTVKVASALRQLRDELASEGQGNQAHAINLYLLSASNDSFARLYDILKGPGNAND
jgi:hypothetical protein